MALKKNKAAIKEQQRQQTGQRKRQLQTPSSQKSYLYLFLILLLSFIVYFPTLRNSFVNWDDQAYIIENPMLRSFDLKDIFSSYQIANYHPLTMLMFTIEYHLFGLNETGYHAVNLLIHLLNTVLVFYFILGLVDSSATTFFKKGDQQGTAATQIALVTTLLFGVHPIHVESVAWASELKDLLYTFFFLASSICYLRYLKDKQRKYYIYALMLFLASLLSKAMAASLPAVLLLIDYFKGRKLDSKVWMEKAPFFILSLIFGIVAVFAQQSLKAIDINIYPFPERIVFASYGFITYLFKLAFPFQLSAYYPYPVRSGEGIPATYFLFVLLMLGLIFVLWRLLSKSKSKPQVSNSNSKIILFGIGFFAITVFLVLQLLPVGGAVMADRYSYIPSIGIFFLAAITLYNLRTKTVSAIILGVFTIFFSIKTYAQCTVWKNGMTLWNDVIRQYQTITIAYYNRGNLEMNDKKSNEAISDFTKAIENDPNYARAYSNRGNVLMDQGHYEEALKDFNKSIELEPDNYRTYNNRGSVYRSLHKSAEALSDFNKSLSLKGDFYEGYNNRGLLFMDEKKYNEARNDFKKAAEMHPDFADSYNNLGLLAMDEKKYEEAISEFNTAIRLHPDFIDGYNNRGYVYAKENKFEDAIRDYNKAIELNRNYARAYYNRANLLITQKKFDEALLDYNKTTELQPDNGEAFFNKAIVEYNSGKKEMACNDFQQSAKLGFPTGANAFRDLCH